MSRKKYQACFIFDNEYCFLKDEVGMREYKIILSYIDSISVNIKSLNISPKLRKLKKRAKKDKHFLISSHKIFIKYDVNVVRFILEYIDHYKGDTDYNYINETFHYRSLKNLFRKHDYKNIKKYMSGDLFKDVEFMLEILKISGELLINNLSEKIGAAIAMQIKDKPVHVIKKIFD